MIGLSLEGRLLSACVVRGRGRRFETGKLFRTELTLDPLTASPELAGQEIRNRLDEAGLQGRACVIAVPASWTFSLQLALPDVGAEDLRSFIELQAERELPFSADDMILSVSRWGEPSARRATVLAIPRVRVDALERVVRAAKLRPLGITTGLTALITPRESDVSLSLLLRERGAELLALVDGVAALRTVEESNAEDHEQGFDAEAIARQIRITLGQLPPDARTAIKSVTIIGEAQAAAELVEDLKDPVGRLGLALHSAEPASVGPVAFKERASSGMAAAAAAAACIVAGQKPAFEFLPPHETKWKVFAHRFSARGTMWGIGAAVVAILAAGATFGYQSYRLGRLESQWTSMEETVKRVKEQQDNIRKYRPWFDDTAPSLRIINTLTGAFPPDGSVYARMVKISNQEKITCTGTAKTDRAMQEMATKLQNAAGVDSLHVDVPSPQQFTLTYQWKGGIPHAE